MAPSTQQQRTLLLSVVAAAAAAGTVYLVWQLSQQSKTTQSKQKTGNDLDDSIDGTAAAKTKKPKSNSHNTNTPTKFNKDTTGDDSDPTPRRANNNRNATAAAATNNTITNDDATAATLATQDDDDDAETTIHTQIETLDKQGKELFKNKKYVEASQAFSAALDVVASHVDFISGNTNNNSASTTAATMSSTLQRQQITLLNNRSAMYEKAAMHELALHDCDAILELEATHTKARTRKLRILEILHRYPEALQEVCAVQLLFMKANRNNLRLGLPVPPPPIPHSKMEEILNAVLPDVTLQYVTALEHRNATTRKLPGTFTILQLLRSYTEYNAWMALAAKDGTVETLTADLQAPSLSVSDQVVMLFRRGRRNVYDRNYEEATVDFEHALALVDEKLLSGKKFNSSSSSVLPEDYFARLLEWTGMVRHWHYDLTSAMECLEKATTLEPKNALLIVKQAGIQLDAGKQEEALELFERALNIDSQSVDALLHRSNLRILQNKPEVARVDLETCIRLRPNNTMARLRLASILVPLEDMDGAKRQIDLAEQSEPNSSEVHSYRGELHFAQTEMDEARRAFEKAIKLEPLNPTPYVNAAMAIMNTPPTHPTQMPDTAKVTRLLEQAIQADSQFAAAYVHLGQLKLGTATDLATAREVIALYDEALEQCRSLDEVKELCGMRVLAVAQVEAATALKMETFNFQ